MKKRILWATAGLLTLFMSTWFTEIVQRMPFILGVLAIVALTATILLCVNGAQKK